MNESIKISPDGKNLHGYYRKCEEKKCPNLIKCPYVRCQECRIDLAIDDYTISHITPENINE